MQTRLTVGMAHHTDYDGVYFTLHALKEYHATDGVELLVVDNSPGKPSGKAVAELCAYMGAKYVPYAEAVGTSAPRDRVFAEASGEAVLCLDCHVLLPSGALSNLLDFWETHDGRADMVTGPLLNDASQLYADHFADVWRAEMWGVWGLAWRCKCGPVGGVRFTVIEPADPATEAPTYRELATQKPIERCEYCRAELPTGLAFHGHQAELDRLGYKPAVTDGQPFEIPGMGLGLFSMRRENWVGFNPDSRGFGGEEMYVHEKVRRAGGRVLCLPGLPWLHRFFRPDGPRYPLDRYGKARNYVLEFQELGLDLDPVRSHFVAEAMMTPAEWDYLLTDPVNHTSSPRDASKPGCGTCGKSAGVQPGDDVGSIDELAAFFVDDAPRDLDKHGAYITELVGKVDHATLIVKRREWDIFAAAGRPARLRSYNAEGGDPVIERLADVISRTETNPKAARRIKTYTRSTVKPESVTELDERTELLVLDSIHSAEQVYVELSRFADMVSRFILVRGTGAFGLKAEGTDGPGLLVGIRRFCRERTAWSVVEHRRDQYGLTLLSCDKRDKPSRPGVLKLASNFAKHVTEYVADGMKQADEETYETRLGICSLCTERSGDHCTVCGCAVAAKAKWRAMECDLGYWPAADAEAAETAEQVQAEVDR